MLKGFLTGTGEELFAIDSAKAAQVKAEASQADLEALSKSAGAAIEKYIRTNGLLVDSLHVRFDAASAAVTVSGVVSDKDTKEKVLQICVNVASVEQVHDMLVVKAPEAFSPRLRGASSRSDESRSTAFPPAVAAGLVAMCLSDGLGWSAYPPTVFLIVFVVTMSVILLGVVHDATKHLDDLPLLAKTPRTNVDVGKSL